MCLYTAKPYDKHNGTSKICYASVSFYNGLISTSYSDYLLGIVNRAEGMFEKAIDGTKYKPGFHRFIDKRHAMMMWSRRFVVCGLLRDIHTIGLQRMNVSTDDKDIIGATVYAECYVGDTFTPYYIMDAKTGKIIAYSDKFRNERFYKYGITPPTIPDDAERWTLKRLRKEGLI